MLDNGAAVSSPPGGLPGLQVKEVGDERGELHLAERGGVLEDGRGAHFSPFPPECPELEVSCLLSSSETAAGPFSAALTTADP